jgi:hypothetical protein
MKITEHTPPVERKFLIELSEDDAHKLLAVLGGQVIGTPIRLEGYNQLRDLVGGSSGYMRRYDLATYGVCSWSLRSY